MALIDKLTKTLAKGPAQPAMEDTQAELEAALAAKSGKAGVSGAPRASRVGQRAGEAQTAAQFAQLQNQGATAAVGLQATQEAQQAAQAAAAAQQAAQAQQARAGIAADVGGSAAARQAQAQQFGIKSTAREAQVVADINHRAREAVQQLATERGVVQADLFSGFKQSTTELAQRRDAAKLEEAAFQASMANKAYVDNLLRVGKERRLNTEANFKLEADRLLLGENTSLLMSKLKHKLDLDANETEFSKQLVDMDITSAMAILDQQKKDAQIAFVRDTGVEVVSRVASMGVSGGPDMEGTTVEQSGN